MIPRGTPTRRTRKRCEAGPTARRMEANRDAALKCRALADKYLREGNKAKCLALCDKAERLAGGSLAGVDMAALATAVSCYPVKFIVAFPLTYHYAGALRHTLWDRKPETMLNNKDAEKSSYLVMGGSTLVAAGLAALSW